MQLPTVERVKAAYAAHPEIRPRYDWFVSVERDEDGKVEVCKCCPMIACLVNEAGLDPLAPADFDFQEVSVLAELPDDLVRAFTRGVDLVEHDYEYDAELAEAYQRGKDVRAAIFPTV